MHEKYYLIEHAYRNWKGGKDEAGVHPVRNTHQYHTEKEKKRKNAEQTSAFSLYRVDDLTEDTASKVWGRGRQEAEELSSEGSHIWISIRRTGLPIMSRKLAG